MMKAIISQLETLIKEGYEPFGSPTCEMLEYPNGFPNRVQRTCYKQAMIKKT